MTKLIDSIQCSRDAYVFSFHEHSPSVQICGNHLWMAAGGCAYMCTASNHKRCMILDSELFDRQHIECIGKSNTPKKERIGLASLIERRHRATQRTHTRTAKNHTLDQHLSSGQVSGARPNHQVSKRRSASCHQLPFDAQCRQVWPRCDP